MILGSFRISGGSLRTISNSFSRSTICEKASPPIATCTTFSTSATFTPWRAHRLAIDLDQEVGLADDVKHAHVLDPRHGLQDAGDALTQLLEFVQIGTDDLDRVGALDAGKCLFHVVADVLGEVEVDPGELLELLHQLSFPCPRG